MVFSYRAYFGGAREGACLFCPGREADLEIILHQDADVLAIQNRGLGGRDHWLIVPRRHIRDVESLTPADVPLLRAMDRVMKTLLGEKYPDVAPSDVYAGYHRGHRPLGGWWGSLGTPDIISIHHLHLHVIVEPYWYSTWLKYPFWFPLMWISAKSVLGMWNLEATTQS